MSTAFTAYEVHYGPVERVAEQRKRALMEAYRKNPERFVNGAPIVKPPPKEVWINKPNIEKQPENVSLITNHQLSHFLLTSSVVLLFPVQ